MERFWSKVEKADGCWKWLGGHSSGRPMFWLVNSNTPAYRVAYELTYGRIPAGTEVDHQCNNKWCVNPSHMKAVPHRDNVLRSDAITGINSRKETCKRGHPLGAWSKTGKHAGKPWRKCHICAMQSQRLRRLAKRKFILTHSQNGSMTP